MVGGYAGKIGFVDLTSGEIKTEVLNEDLARQFLRQQVHRRRRAAGMGQGGAKAG